jgi:putative tryptophan/tyrosine transport system substrate-binding protein
MGSDMKRRNFTMAIGGAVLWPLKVWAQANSQTKRVGVLIARAEIDPEGKQHSDALVNELERLGWSRGRNLEMETRWWSSDAIKRLAFVRELVALKPDVMLVNSSSYLTAARPEVGNIPVVFVAVTDPVVQGFVQSLAHPGGSMTGFGAEEPSMGSKWIELLKEIAPNTRSVTAVFNPETASIARFFMPSVRAVQSSISFDLTEAPVRNEAELESAIAAAALRPNPGLIFLPDSFLQSRPGTVAGLAAKYKLPAVYSVSAFARSGGLLTFGIERVDLFVRAAGYVDRILKGEKPINLPVQMPNKFELVINLKTAKALGLTVPPSLLARADEVIE